MIHQYKLSGYNIVLDVYSGSVHAVDDVAYDAIALIDQGSSREQAAAALAKKYADRADVTAADINDVLDAIANQPTYGPETWNKPKQMPVITKITIEE